MNNRKIGSIICRKNKNVYRKYIKLYNNGPERNYNNYVLYARYIMEKHIHRKLKKHEVVHHINGNTLDDRLENLRLMTDSEHCKLHRKGKKPYKAIKISSEIRKKRREIYYPIIKKLIEEKMSIRAITKKLKIGRGRIKRIIAENNLHSPTQKESVNNIKLLNKKNIINLWMKGYSPIKISDILKLSKVTIYKNLKECELYVNKRKIQGIL